MRKQKDDFSYNISDVAIPSHLVLKKAVYALNQHSAYDAVSPITRV